MFVKKRLFSLICSQFFLNTTVQVDNEPITGVVLLPLSRRQFTFSWHKFIIREGPNICLNGTDILTVIRDEIFRNYFGLENVMFHKEKRNSMQLILERSYDFDEID